MVQRGNQTGVRREILYLKDLFRLRLRAGRVLSESFVFFKKSPRTPLNTDILYCMLTRKIDDIFSNASSSELETI